MVEQIPVSSSSWEKGNCYSEIQEALAYGCSSTGLVVFYYFPYF